jgi:hypothetical protein
MSNRLIKFLEEIGAHKITIDFAKKNIVECSKCLHSVAIWVDRDDGPRRELICDVDGKFDCKEDNANGDCVDFEKAPWWAFWRRG